MFTNRVVLVVDDEPELRLILVETFQGLNAKVLQAENGKIALETLRIAPVDVVITDVDMPVLNGLDLLEKIKGEKNMQPVVFIVTGNAKLSADVALKKGAAGYFLKPYELSLITSEVNRVLGLHGQVS